MEFNFAIKIDLKTFDKMYSGVLILQLVSSAWSTEIYDLWFMISDS